MEIARPPDLTNLMSAWGGFDAPAGAIGPEKRLELDFRASAKVTPEAIKNVATTVVEALDLALVSREENTDSTTIICDGAIIIATNSRVVVTANSGIPLHTAVAQLVAVAAAADVEIEWASFMHKSNTCPWETSDTTIAHEYAKLKAVFQSGNPFIFGSLDSDHYFYFVYDDLKRGTVVESDFQLNIKMYNVDASADVAKVAFTPETNVHSTVSKAGQYQGATHLPQGCHESLRFAENGEYACFETTEPSVLSGDRVKAMLDAAQPDRFTIVLLADPECCVSKALAQRKTIGIEPHNFSGYSLHNRTVNEFAPGYVVVQMSYTR